MAERKINDRFSSKAQAENTMDARIVAQLHRNADTDTSKQAVHHTIGPAPDQVASGAHTHDGVETRQLLSGISITGSRGGNIALASVIDALQALGAEDNTTA
jgi:hypothetical protein